MSTMTGIKHSTTKSAPTIFAFCALIAFGVWGYQSKARVIPFQSLSEEHHIGEEKPKRKRVVYRPVAEPQGAIATGETIKSAPTNDTADDSAIGNPELDDE